MSTRRSIRVFRVSGDSLSCWFSPDGTLSTAVLRVSGSERRVESQLPGLCSTNAIEYLADLGYRTKHNSKDISLARELESLLSKEPLFVECLVRGEGVLTMSVGLREDRHLPCPRRAFVALYCPGEADPDFVAVSDKRYVERFLSAVQSLDVV